MEHKFRPKPRKNFLEADFFLSDDAIERYVGISKSELLSVPYSLDGRTSQYLAKRQLSGVREVLLHRDRSTIIVPPLHSRPIQITELPVMALPVVDFIDFTQPDIVVGCDRGARLYAVAVHALWGKIKNNLERFPTLDSKIHFARLSTSLGLRVTHDAIKRIIAVSAKYSKSIGKATNNERLRILFIDDWISSGATRDHIRQSLSDMGILNKIEVNFAVMCGSSADVSGGHGKVNVPWQDNPNYIGVNYTKDGFPFRVRTNEAKKARLELHQAITEFAHSLLR
jgi:hypothetical protein